MIITTSASEHKNDINKISDWFFLVEDEFQPLLKRQQAQEVIFSRKSKTASRPPLVLNNANV